MGRINLLDVEISNKIAAGEVVERPASVVKELVENSIDAGAKKIVVEIKKGGSTYIRVTDDGSGMERDDAVVAFLRHATSKISTADDLNAIYTLGFRGEALSSIGAVAEVDLYTKRREDFVGVHTVCKGGEIVSDDDAGIPDGTSIVVKNLFYNVPARMKFLKKDATEAGYISDIITRFILAHPEIPIKLIVNSKEALFSTGDGNLKNCVYSVYGKDYASAMIEVDYKGEIVGVSGLIGKSSCARPNRNYQSFFVNGRYIKSPMITRAVEEAYKNQIMTGKFPTCVLNININPALIDINVHPTKLEVKFSNDSEVYQSVYYAVKEALYRIADIPKINTPSVQEKKNEPQFIRDSVAKDAQLDISKTFNIKPNAEKVQPEIKKETDGKKEEKKEFKTVYDSTVVKVESPKLFERDISTIGQTQPTPKLFEKKEDIKPISPTPVLEKKEEIEKIKEQEEKIIPKKTEEIQEKNTEFKLVGQVFNTYIIIEQDNNMLMVDQHAAHERLNFERLKKELEENRVYSQGLLIPVVVELSSNEMAVFSQHQNFISSLGFDAEEYGNNVVIIRSVPTSSDAEDISDLFIEILSQLEENKQEVISQKKERLLYTIACKAAVKANARLSDNEQKDLVKKVLELDNINTCPHGRPIMISMTKYEIEKNFKRIV